ncbi:MAG: hypothetical protein A4E45_00990 [Methanosaeta sp. PtaB.Bin039]|nr:MAG: hypothetical protein A4E45_00990 [Methanosaeta sp. PtaB.Bin039]OPY44725.1 MAG: hypothetical protein A4E47_01352 [Methanosaeta sp. PtaU1.Bin028]
MKSAHRLILVLSLLLASAGTIIPSAAIRQPYQMEETPRSDLQDIIDAAASGSTIELEDEIYHGTVIIEKPLILTASGSQVGHPVIDAQGSANGITITADGAAVHGVLVTNASGSGILLKSSSCTITRNLLIRNGIGISLQDAKDNFLANNTAWEDEIGLYLNSSNQNMLQDNLIASSDIGLSLIGSSSNQILSNLIISSALGIELDRSRRNLISGNDLSDNLEAAHDSSSNRWSLRGAGNYYGPCMDTDYDGICDQTTSIPGGRSEDSAPLSHPPLTAAQYAPEVPAGLTADNNAPANQEWGEVGQTMEQMRTGAYTSARQMPGASSFSTPVGLISQQTGSPDLPPLFDPYPGRSAAGTRSGIWQTDAIGPQLPGASAAGQAESIDLLDHGMSRGVDPSGQPVDRTSSFSAVDAYAYSWVSFGPVYYPHSLDWRWYSPSGALHSTSSGAIPDPGSRGLAHWYSPKYWSQLAIRGASPASTPGTWRVEFSLDGKLMVEEEFTIS